MWREFHNFIGLWEFHFWFFWLLKIFYNDHLLICFFYDSIQHLRMSLFEMERKTAETRCSPIHFILKSLNLFLFDKETSLQIYWACMHACNKCDDIRTYGEVTCQEHEVNVRWRRAFGAFWGCIRGWHRPLTCSLQVSWARAQNAREKFNCTLILHALSYCKSTNRYSIFIFWTWKFNFRYIHHTLTHSVLKYQKYRSVIIIL